MTQEATRQTKPILLYDGDCTFCKAWIAHWRSLTGDAVEYAPYQDAAAGFPQIAVEQLKRAVHLVEPGGQVTRGAEAVFRTLSGVPGRGWLHGAYRAVPGFAAVTEAGYRFVAGHRSALWFPTRLFWGRRLERPTYFLSRWLFLRLLGVIYLIAFASLWVQWPGLFGSNGILPAQGLLDAVGRHFAEARFWRWPTLCWLRADDSFLNMLCIGGMALSVVQIVGLAQRLVLLLLWALYLSLFHAGGDFLSFQWDLLLLETGLLAVLFAPKGGLPSPSRETDPPCAWRLLFAWLLFRLMFLSGITKLTYDDPTWWNLTALTHHYETQPLATWTSWYAHHLPLWFQKASCAIMFAIELGLPFLIFGPRRLRHLAFVGLVLLQLLIAATGNYNFFNLLTCALCLPLLDDAALSAVLPRGWTRRFPCGRPPRPVALWRRIAAAPIFTVFAITGYFEAREQISRQYRPPEFAQSLLDALRPFRSINGYGLFRVMTTSRPEIVIEGSSDGIAWQEYELPWKAGDVKRRPAFVQPHQPRLDWQMWFAALSAPRRPPWFDRFILRLLEGAPPVLALIEKNPFPAAPPRYIRAVLYDYRFTTAAERAATGAWWKRRRVGWYLPQVSLPRE